MEIKYSLLQEHQCTSTSVDLVLNGMLNVNSISQYQQMSELHQTFMHVARSWQPLGPPVTLQHIKYFRFSK